MAETGLKSTGKLEGVKAWKKCVWKSIYLETGAQSFGENMQGIAILVVMQGVIHFFGKPGEESFFLREYEVCLLSVAPPFYKIAVQEETHLLMCIFHLDIVPFSKDMLAALTPFYKRGGHRHTILKMNDITCSFVKLLYEYLKKGFESDLLFEIKRQELFLLLFATYPKQELASFFFPLIGDDIQFQEFVISNYSKAKNVQNLAQMANYSTSGFIKKFKRYFHESPHQWMSRHKAKLILDEICSSQTSLKEVAYKFNFSTYQHFVDFCKMQFGVAPSRLR